MNTELKNCPFCREWGAECAESDVPSIHGGQKKAVYCNSCFCEGPTSETEAGAIEAWNRRAALTPPEGSDQSLLELACMFETCIDFLPPVGQKNIAKAVAQLRAAAMLAARPEVKP